MTTQSQTRRLIIGVAAGCFLLGIVTMVAVRTLHERTPHDEPQGIIRWGMSPAQVRQIEDATLTEATDTDLYYTLIQTPLPIAVHYHFVQDRLVEITRVPGEQYASLEDALDAVETLLKNYKQFYGALSEESILPERVEFVWNTSDTRIAVIIWYVQEGGFWAWTAISREATAVEPPPPIANDADERG